MIRPIHHSALLAAALASLCAGFGCANRAQQPIASNSNAECVDRDSAGSAAPAASRVADNSASRKSVLEIQVSSPATKAPPTRDELPTHPLIPERQTSAKIESEGSFLVTKRRFVPDFKEPELTPAEKKALGVDDSKDDLLGFYRPERRSEHGVMPLAGTASVGRGGVGGATTGLETAHPRFATYGTAGSYGSSAIVGRTPAEVDSRGRGADIGLGLPWYINIGYAPIRRAADRRTFLDP